MPDIPANATIEELLRHREWALRLARGLVRDESRADDVVQDSLLAAIQHPPATLDTPKPWLARVVRSWAARSGRSQGRRDRHERAAPSPDATESTFDVVARADLHRFLANAVFELREPYRTTLLLRYFDGLSQRQVAARTGVTLDTARTRLRRGLARLRQRLAERAQREGNDWRGALVALVGRSSRRRLVAATSAAVAVALVVGVVVAGHAAAGASGTTPTSTATPRSTPTRSGRARPEAAPELDAAATTTRPADVAAPLPVRRPIGSFGGDAPWIDPAALVTSIAFASDGRTLVASGSDGTAKLWSTSTGEILRTFPVGSGAATCVAVSPDGRELVAGCEDGGVRAWDLARDADLGVVAKHDAPVREIAWGPRGLVASSDTSGAVMLWRSGDREVVARLRVRSSGYARSLAFAPDGSRLVAATTTLDGVTSWPLDGAGVPGEPVVLSGLGRICRLDRGGAAVWTASAESLVLTTFDGDVLRRLAGAGADVTALEIVPGLVVAGTRDGVVEAWGDDDAPRWTTHLASPAVMAMATSPDGDVVACATNTGRIELLDAKTGRAVEAPEHKGGGHAWAISSLALDPFGRFVASGSWDGTVKLWDMATRDVLRTLRGHTDRVVAVDVSPCGRFVASASHDKTVRLWDAADGTPLRTLVGHADIVAAVRFDPDGRFVLSGSKDKTAILWNAETGEIVRVFRGHADQVRAVAFLPRGRVATASEDGTLRIWSRDTGAVLRVLEGHGDRVTSLAVTPDGTRLVSAGHDGTVRAWDVETGACEVVMTGHRGWIHAVAVSADGRFAASAGHDATLRRWDLSTGQAQDLLVGHEVAADAVAFTADGRMVSAGWDKRILLWSGPEESR